MLNEPSPKHERSLVHKVPAAENARSASTDVAGMDKRKPYTICKQRPRLPLFSKTVISVLIAAVKFFSVSVAFIGAGVIDDFMACSSCSCKLLPVDIPLLCSSSLSPVAAVIRQKYKTLLSYSL